MSRKIATYLTLLIISLCACANAEDVLSKAIKSVKEYNVKKLGADNYAPKTFSELKKYDIEKARTKGLNKLVQDSIKNPSLHTSDYMSKNRRIIEDMIKIQKEKKLSYSIEHTFVEYYKYDETSRVRDSVEKKRIYVLTDSLKIFTVMNPGLFELP